MPAVLYTAARWTELVAAAIGILALVTAGFRLRRQPSGPVLGPLCILVTAVAVGAGSAVFLSTRVQQVRLDSIRALGLESGHAGLRSEAEVYDVTASVPVSLRPVPPVGLGKTIDKISGYLVHQDTTVHAQVAVYGLVDFTALRGTSATVDRQARTITVPLPSPQIGPSTVYISALDGTTVKEGPLSVIGQSMAGILNSALGRPVESFNSGPALARAEAAALRQARGSRVLAACGRQEITAQLTRLLHLTPAYRGYQVRVTWPGPAPSGVDCAAWQRRLAAAGS